ncbi:MULTISPECIES: glycosyltransferase [unclassified Luteimonas]|uniref:glycosyltransferase n=1 Tax=unclassified Luteimonas TaxID=2629088 RepID=UPI0018F062C6|nr:MULTISPECIES: glycosyltransferase [unclassified Luteimonas]MBJ6979190.1 glycosyltransferase [Luteimonas sp. MC1895]MBJ6985207.1 glycosyltransferase [Luteimonas sp. MC1750]QQO05855.1 glycosyltransferase [Luteimonas sp. MC1750]
MHDSPRSLAAAPQPIRVPGTRGFPLIVHCHLRWDFVWQRPQQLFSRLAPDHPVLFIEEPMHGAAEPSLDITEPFPNLVRLVPQLPHGAAGDSDGEWRLLLPLIEHALATHPLMAGRYDDAVQWFYSPMSAPVLLGRFGTRGTVYDCMDELANFRFAPPDITEREQYLMARADIVYTGGHQLFESKSRHHSNVHFHGCGVDASHFGRARLASTQVPERVASLPGPVFGYFGVIDERLDYGLIEALARDFPEASVVMAGPLAKVSAEELPDLPNIHWLGQQAYDALPALVKGFDVCLMPFALNEATRCINPTKTLEYMAAGKPIVSTAVPDVVHHFTPVVSVAQDHEGFLDAVALAAREPDPVLLREGIARAMQASWDSTVATMRTELLDAVRAVRAEAATAQ